MSERPLDLETLTPSRTVYSDRFIPSRSGSNPCLFHISTPAKANHDHHSSSTALPTILRSVLFGSPETPENRNIFRYKTEIRRSPPHSSFPLGFNDSDAPGVNLNAVKKTPRKFPDSPYKVLDAPGLEDNFYLDLLDWSSYNVLAVGLGNCVYLWNGCSNKVNKLCELGTEDNVCSVGWSQCGTDLCVGTSNGKVQV